MRDYSSISPSAKSLLLMKGLTDIPFIADAAKLVWGKDTVKNLPGLLEKETFIKRLIHFEARYKSVDMVMELIGGKNIIELSSGYSFRGLHMTLNHPDVFYADTDLPEVIEIKADLTTQFIEQQQLELQGELLTLPLNALDEGEFRKITGLLPPGPVNIVNEGLLMYLNTVEKEKLCKIIHRILKERGGYWITADIYVRKDIKLTSGNDMFNRFLEAHNVEENKFESFEQAEQFFYKQGFRIHHKAGPVWHHLSALKYMEQDQLTQLVQQAGKLGKIRETWALIPF
jgi:O-methyltransferase involved in polyketide biosynthesis